MSLISDGISAAFAMLGDAAISPLAPDPAATAALDVTSAAALEAAPNSPTLDDAPAPFALLLAPNPSEGGLAGPAAELAPDPPNKETLELAEPALATAATEALDEGAVSASPEDEAAAELPSVDGATELAPKVIDLGPDSELAGAAPKVKPLVVDGPEDPAVDTGADEEAAAPKATDGLGAEDAVGVAPNVTVAGADDAAELAPKEKPVCAGAVVDEAAELAPKPNPVEVGVVATAELTPKLKPVEAGA